MVAQMSERLTVKHPLGAFVTEGKTKKIHLIKSGSDLVTVIAKDDITAGDGAKHDIIPDKGRLATATTSNVFRLLKACGLPVASLSKTARLRSSPKCDVPYEVVVRRSPRPHPKQPHFSGQLFPADCRILLKTKDRD